MKERKDIYPRAMAIYFGFVGLMVLVLINTFSLQMDESENEFSTSSESNEKIPTRTTKRMPRRGQILDMRGTPLVTSVSTYDIHMDPTVIDKKLFDKDIYKLCVQLSALFPKQSAREYMTYIRKGEKMATGIC